MSTLTPVARQVTAKKTNARIRKIVEGTAADHNGRVLDLDLTPRAFKAILTFDTRMDAVNAVNAMSRLAMFVASPTFTIVEGEPGLIVKAAR